MPPPNFSIGNWTVEAASPPLIIAELSANHGGHLQQALALVDAAKSAGANAIKLQTYTPSSMTPVGPEGNYAVEQESSPWRGQSLTELYTKAQTPRKWHRLIFERAKELNLLAFSSPFDEAAVDFLEECDVPAYKVASFESTHLPLLDRIAKTKKPLLLSTGATLLSEISRVVEFLHARDCRQVILLKCVSAYPASCADAHLKSLDHLFKTFGHFVGFSDHTLGIGAAVAAVALGAKVIEKHLTLDRALPTPDRDFSLEPAEFRQLVDACHQAHRALGNATYGLSTEDLRARELRRSIYAKKTILKGQKLRADDLSVLRPARGISPLEWDLVLERVATREISANTPVQWEMLR